MERVSIQDLAAILVTKSGLKKKDAERFATVIFDVIKDGLISDRLVKIKGLGTFKIIDIESRESVNVNTGERVMIEGHGKITFTPDTTMKELVNKPFSQFETVILNDGVEFNDDEAESEVDTEIEEAEAPEAEVPEAEVPEVEVPEVEVPETEAPEDKVPETEVPEPDVQEPEAPAPEPYEPEMELEQESEAVPQADEIETPVMESYDDEIATEEKSFQEEDAAEEETDEELRLEKSDKKIWLWGMVAVLFAFVVGFAVGRFTKQAPADDDKTVATATKQPAPVAIDTLAAVKLKAEPTVAVAADTVTKKVETVEKVVEQPSVDYNQMDARVRTGAYRIVGTAQEVKVRAGETAKRISQRFLGPDMECYVEVYNGIKSTTELKEGQILKIPKLELKKKKQQTKK